MKRTMIVVGLLLLAAPALSRADAVVDWNAIAAQGMAGPNPLPHTRQFAILHVAMYDAVISVTRDHAPYGFAVEAPAGASPEAAAIAAAHAVLVALQPANATTLDLHYVNALASIRDGQSKNDGIAVGQQVAAMILAARAADGFSAPVPAIDDGTAPYQWRRTPPPFAPPLLPHFARVTPWVIERADQFLPPPPPALGSRAYARAFDEVKEAGFAGSITRTPDRTDRALFHALSHAVFWNDVARQLCVGRLVGLSRTARLFALLNTAFMDAYIGVWHAKFDVYFNWRPITAIQLADEDGNPRTTADALWVPLSVTPPHPTYPSGHAAGSGAAAYILQRFFGRNGHSIVVTSPTAPGVTLYYDRLRTIVDDVLDARVDAGIHFRFDDDAGVVQGRETARYVFKHAFRYDGVDYVDDPE